MKSGDPTSPWGTAQGWRMLDAGKISLEIAEEGSVRSVSAHSSGGGWAIHIEDGARVQASSVEITETEVSAQVGDKALRFSYVAWDDQIVLYSDRTTTRFTVIDPLASAVGGGGPDHSLTAPMPGKVTAISVAPGDSVSSGQALLVLEAMKMEHTIRAPDDGIVATLPFAVGDQVAEGAALITFEESEG